ncbi:ATP-dependent DNA helicase RecG [Rarobacter faecitabidus]|uniref:Probable DNA 3'-5' helicase RecG n=1 Tax=Rarobacter faecitabidus TaxID=13243 RepID=A0A542ZUT6_RARFA|nr:ATP-dependent DNA helicase RecG [Rarobacter faecitabidus]TQL64081.1 ATP-dependent DNA helicase RecG [Rarobacter faecitabidus]
MNSSLVPYLDLPVAKVVRPPDPTSDAEKQRAGLIAQTIKALPAMGIDTVRDLVYYFPRNYLDSATLTSFLELTQSDEDVTLIARVLTLTQRRTYNGDKILTNVEIGDAQGGRLSATFFAKSQAGARYLERMLRPGTQAIFSGKIREYRGREQLSNPDYELLDVGTDYGQESIARAGDLLAVYRGRGKASSRGIRTVLREVLTELPDVDEFDPIDPAIRAERKLLGLTDALRAIHRPASAADYASARGRFRYEEALVLQTELARRRAAARSHAGRARPGRGDGILAEFDSRLPFALTGSQVAVGETLAEEIASDTPMLRLLQGDVGAGKTVVALRAMLQVVDAGGQAALLAPTEVLAAQHARSITEMLGDLGEGGTLSAAPNATKVTLLTGSLGAAARKQALLDAASGMAGIVVGTHALLSDIVQFADLGLVVVDEQHRFGVEQRDVLRGRAKVMPHTLVMTATPIPRTVAMTVFGDLEVSTLTDTPARLHARSTHVVPEANERWFARVWERLGDEVRRGHRGFVVCSRISDEAQEDEATADVEPDESGGAEGPPRHLHTTLETAAMLSEQPALAGARIGVLHGRMAPEAKDAAMAAFASGEIDVLVSTTVIEVGVNVPEATIMVVLDADRFGISQLHQLRGRVGRGADAGICLLVSPADPLSVAGQRLSALAESDDGFELANIDLRLRREGDVLGAGQSGYSSSLKLLRVIDDADLIARARDDADRIVAVDPSLAGHRMLAGAIAEMLAGREEFIERT